MEYSSKLYKSVSGESITEDQTDSKVVYMRPEPKLIRWSSTAFPTNEQKFYATGITRFLAAYFENYRNYLNASISNNDSLSRSEYYNRANNCAQLARDYLSYAKTLFADYEPDNLGRFLTPKAVGLDIASPGILGRDWEQMAKSRSRAHIIREVDEKFTVTSTDLGILKLGQSILDQA